jgi:hypothetical protein
MEENVMTVLSMKEDRKVEFVDLTSVALEKNYSHLVDVSYVGRIRL